MVVIIKNGKNVLMSSNDSLTIIYIVIMLFAIGIIIAVYSGRKD